MGPGRKGNSIARRLLARGRDEPHFSLTNDGLRRLWGLTTREDDLGLDERAMLALALAELKARRRQHD